MSHAALRALSTVPKTYPVPNKDVRNDECMDKWGKESDVIEKGTADLA